MYQWTTDNSATIQLQASGGLTFYIKEVKQDLATGHGQQLSKRAAIQPHVPQHRKHLAVYRMCLMKACVVYLDLVTNDDFS